MTIIVPLFLLFVLGILLVLYVEMWALLKPTTTRLTLGVVSLALGCGAHVSLFYISLKVGLPLIPTINVIHLAFSYHYICLALLIALMGICDIGTAKVAYGFLCKQHHIQLMIGSLLIYSIC